RSDYFKEIESGRVGAIDARAIARELNLGTTASLIINTIMLGAFARISGMVDIELITAAIRKNIPEKPEANISGAKRAYEEVK
ncbi:MAG: 2-oxoacid:acceptor oxidoreductase family protein, partial [Deltaproteobacteria bacterium]|nr:2-oxoacid:acceptor oxidoreductase family protein [Deltaproteobacteria bacterium]